LLASSWSAITDARIFEIENGKIKDTGKSVGEK
jgi:hypothetical protein